MHINNGHGSASRQRARQGRVRAPALIIKAHVKLGIHLVAAADHAQVSVAVEHDAHLQSVHCSKTRCCTSQSCPKSCTLQGPAFPLAEKPTAVILVRVGSAAVL